MALSIRTRLPDRFALSGWMRPSAWPRGTFTLALLCACAAALWVTSWGLGRTGETLQQALFERDVARAAPPAAYRTALPALAASLGGRASPEAGRWHTVVRVDSVADGAEAAAVCAFVAAGEEPTTWVALSDALLRCPGAELGASPALVRVAGEDARALRREIGRSRWVLADTGGDTLRLAYASREAPTAGWRSADGFFHDPTPGAVR